MAKIVFGWHGKAAFVLVLLVGVHVAAALYHHLIRKDNVLRRMLPGK
jgi:cytochrome b561